MPHKVKSDFKNDADFIAYMKQRRIQLTNYLWRNKTLLIIND